MGFWTLFEVASMPVLQVLIISVLGAFLASGYSNILTASARRDLNKVVFTIFTPALMFASLAKTVTLEEIISWWFMPVNIGLVVFIGSFLAWIAVKIVKLPPYLEKVFISICSAGNFGNLLLILVPAVCNEDGDQFGNQSVCTTRGLSYVSFSMALGGFYIWTFSYSLMKHAGDIYATMKLTANGISVIPSKDLEPCLEAHHIKIEGDVDNGDEPLLLPSTKPIEEDVENENMVPLLSSGKLSENKEPFWKRLKGALFHVVEELMAPPTFSAILGFIFGAIPWLKFLLIGENAPLRVIQDTVELLGQGTIPCITLILGGNLIQGLGKSKVKPSLIFAIICVKYVILPIIGIGMVNLAAELGFLSSDPLYRYVLMIQYTVPPAMNMVTIAQLFDVGQEECSVILLWNYLAAALALTVWSTVFLWILS